MPTCVISTIIKEGHPWNTDEVFDFYGLAIKPMPDAAVLAYKQLVARSL